MHPHETGILDQAKIELESKDFNQEQVWNKIFRYVDCDHCSKDGECTALGYLGQGFAYKCPKWENLNNHCTFQFQTAGTYPTIGTGSPVILTGNIIWNANSGVIVSGT